MKNRKQRALPNGKASWRADLTAGAPQGLFRCLLLSLWAPGKMKNSIFQISMVPHTLNIKNWRITSAKTISLVIIRKLIEYSLKNVSWTQYLLLPFSRYCCLKEGQGAKGLFLIYTSDLSDDLSSNVIYLLSWYTVFLIIMTKSEIMTDLNRPGIYTHLFLSVEDEL